ncbi:AP2 domain-containing protein [Paraburkholderia phenoliruptrix]|uniref:AP2 domain-containing protein n=1 Tax=Paraburkholderia phenoliruptrix TaxID=252970 RepID=UPI0028543F04|nr:AP2 domain-containing protein [Paraburkholderia phenoliruptrix]MDR6393480.1 hypothetical protein [Paraburkholderia phenoliruptrix]
MKPIQLPHGSVAIVDDEDFDRVNSYRWYMTGNGYARTNKNVGGLQRGMAMHRFILEIQTGDERIVDHIDGNRLNNQKANLRICTHAQNLRNQKRRRDNTTGYKGVTFDVKAGRFHAQIRNNGARKHLGHFDTAEEAHAAYCAAALELHGEFANFGDQT